MKINKHGNLIDTAMAGNGYHGRCEHCKLAFVTDLGYCSWSDTTCIDREITSSYDVPKDIKNYAEFNGMIFKVNKKGIATYVKPYDNKTYTLEQIQRKIKKLLLENNIA